MIEGMPASSSVTFFKKEERAPVLKYSPIKMEIAREKGREMNSAINDVMSVPTRKGSAPKVCETGSHVFPSINEDPKAMIEGKEDINRLTKTAPNKTTIAKAERKIVL